MASCGARRRFRAPHSVKKKSRVHFFKGGETQVEMDMVSQQKSRKPRSCDRAPIPTICSNCGRQTHCFRRSQIYYPLLERVEWTHSHVHRFPYGTTWARVSSWRLTYRSQAYHFSEWERSKHERYLLVTTGTKENIGIRTRIAEPGLPVTGLTRADCHHSINEIPPPSTLTGGCIVHTSPSLPYPTIPSRLKFPNSRRHPAFVKVDRLGWTNRI